MLESTSCSDAFWCTEMARHDRRRLSFAVWAVLAQKLLEDRPQALAIDER